MSPRTRWSLAWLAWLLLGLLLEVKGLFAGRPLTTEVRHRLLPTAAGSAAIGGFLGWLAFHWLLDGDASLGTGDVVGTLLGVLVGLAGWSLRRAGR